MDTAEAKKAIEADKKARSDAALKELQKFIEEWGERHRVRLRLGVTPVDMGNGIYGMRPNQYIEALD